MYRGEEQGGMTPLAERIMRQCIGDLIGERFWIENRDLALEKLRGAHFFELTQAIPLMNEICTLMKAMGQDRAEIALNEMTFLPAPKTWLEWKHPTAGMRVALLLCQDEEAAKASVDIFFEQAASKLGEIDLLGNEYTRATGDVLMPSAITDRFGHKAIDGFLSVSHFMLVAINSPKIVGRSQHMPSGRLEKIFLKQRKQVGSFPLGAWTEIKLAIAPALDASGDGSHEAHLTGQRALHFCRQHLRVRYGRLELVKAHWRGDAAVGIKRSRYVVTP